MSISAKLLLASGGCILAFLVDVTAGHLLYGSRDEGFAGLMNFTGLGLVAGAVMTLLASAWSAFTVRRRSSGR